MKYVIIGLLSCIALLSVVAVFFNHYTPSTPYPHPEPLPALITMIETTEGYILHSSEKGYWPSGEFIISHISIDNVNTEIHVKVIQPEPLPQ